MRERERPVGLLPGEQMLVHFKRIRGPSAVPVRWSVAPALEFSLGGLAQSVLSFTPGSLLSSS